MKQRKMLQPNDGSDIMRKYLILLLSLMMCIAMLSGCNDSAVTTPQSAGGTTAVAPTTGDSNAPQATRDPNAPPDTGSIHPIPDRTAWNIEMAFVKYEGGIITVSIRDNDNQGFYFNDLYFELEILMDGNWVKITRLNETAAYKDYIYLFPSEVDDYVDMWSFNRTIALNEGVTLETGRYKLTKVLSGRKISFEFDMVIN